MRGKWILKLPSGYFKELFFNLTILGIIFKKKIPILSAAYLSYYFIKLKGLICRSLRTITSVRSHIVSILDDSVKIPWQILFPLKKSSICSIIELPTKFGTNFTLIFCNSKLQLTSRKNKKYVTSTIATFANDCCRLILSNSFTVKWRI